MYPELSNLLIRKDGVTQQLKALYKEQDNLKRHILMLEKEKSIITTLEEIDKLEKEGEWE